MTSIVTKILQKIINFIGLWHEKNFTKKIKKELLTKKREKEISKWNLKGLKFKLIMTAGYFSSKAA